MRQTLADCEPGSEPCVGARDGQFLGLGKGRDGGDGPQRGGRVEHLEVLQKL